MSVSWLRKAIDNACVLLGPVTANARPPAVGTDSTASAGLLLGINVFLKCLGARHVLADLGLDQYL